MTNIEELGINCVLKLSKSVYRAIKNGKGSKANPHIVPVLLSNALQDDSNSTFTIQKEEEGEGNKKGYENKTICRTSSDSRQILGVTFDGCRLWSQ